MLNNRRKRKEFVGRRQQYRRVLEAVKKTFSVNNSNRMSCNNVAVDISDEIDMTSSNSLNSNVDLIINNATSNNENISENSDCSDVYNTIIILILILCLTFLVNTLIILPTQI